MAVTIKKKILYQILFGLCCAVPYLSNYELTFGLWCFTILVTLKRSFSFTFLSYTFCFVAIFIIALIGIDFENAKLYSIVRDFTYILKPFLGLLIGYQICRFIYNNAFKTIIYTAFFIAIIHLGLIVIAVLMYHKNSVALLRDYCGYFSDFEVYALIILIFHKQFEFDLSKKRFYTLIITIGVSAFLYLARTNFIQFVVLFLGIKGYYVLNKKSVIALSSVVVSTLVLYSTIVLINPKRTGSAVEEFLYKIKVAPIEPFKSKVDASNYIDFNLNYRSVELIYTLNQVKNKGYSAILFGCGLGSEVDLKQFVFLGDMKLRYIPVLHNAFMTTYLKSGILGIIILLYSIFLLFNQKKSNIPINQQVNFLLIGTSVFLLVSNWVLMGYYFTMDSKTILVGLFFAYKEITYKKSLENNIDLKVK